MLKKEITIGQAIAIILTASMALFTWGMSISTRLEGSEVRIEKNEEQLETNTRKIEKVDDKMDENFKIIIDKLERISERQNELK